MDDIDLPLDTDFWVSIGIIVALILLSAFFSGSETALTATREARLSQLAKKGNKRASDVLDLKHRNDSLIGAILIGNNIANIGASALATGALIALFGANGVAYATIGMTVIVVILAEVLPKTFAINNADKVALAVSPLIRLLVFVLSPVTAMVQGMVRGVLRLVGVSVEAGIGHDEREEELRGLIELHDGEGDETEHERAMLRSILDLADVEVMDIMTHRRNVRMLDADAALSVLLDTVLESPYTRVPLYRNNTDNIVAILHVKDLLRAIRSGETQRNENFDILSIASAPWFIPDTSTLLDQLQAFRERREHFAVVVDEYGSFMGVVTLEDILEEIVGDIVDEHDVHAVEARPQADGSYLISGSVTIRDLNREYEWDLPDDQASTLAGLVLHEARVIPEVGQEFVFHGFRFSIVRRQRNQITALRVRPVEEEAETS